MSLMLSCTAQANSVSPMYSYDKEKTEQKLNELVTDLNLNAEPAYTEEDVDLFARLINAEMGCSWFSDELLMYTGSVVLNRIDNTKYNNTLYDVIYEGGQYKSTWDGGIEKPASERHYRIAKELLENGSVIPQNVVYQAEFKQGSKVFYKYSDKILGNTTYFCYQ